MLQPVSQAAEVMLREGLQKKEPAGVAYMDSMFVGGLDFVRSWLLFFFYLYLSLLAWPLKLYLTFVFECLTYSERLPIIGIRVKRAKSWVTGLPVFSWALK